MPFHPEKKRHAHTAVAATGAAQPFEGGKLALHDLSVVLPKWAEAVPVDRKLCIPPTAALSLELEGARAVEKLRHRLYELAKAHKANVSIRPLTFERWRFAVTWEEAQSGVSAPKKALHPLLPSQADGRDGPATQGLMDDLQWCNRRRLQPRSLSPSTAHRRTPRPAGRA